MKGIASGFVLGGVLIWLGRLPGGAQTKGLFGRKFLREAWAFSIFPVQICWRFSRGKTIRPRPAEALLPRYCSCAAVLAFDVEEFLRDLEGIADEAHEIGLPEDLLGRRFTFERGTVEFPMALMGGTTLMIRNGRLCFIGTSISRRWRRHGGSLKIIDALRNWSGRPGRGTLRSSQITRDAWRLGCDSRDDARGAEGSEVEEILQSGN